MKTVTANPQNETRKWWVIDAKDAVLGRLSTTAAKLLMGKHKASYHPAHDHGDFVVIINADKVALTGTKREDFTFTSVEGGANLPGGAAHTFEASASNPTSTAYFTRRDIGPPCATHDACAAAPDRAPAARPSRLSKSNPATPGPASCRDSTRPA